MGQGSLSRFAFCLSQLVNTMAQGYGSAAPWKRQPNKVVVGYHPVSQITVRSSIHTVPMRSYRKMHVLHQYCLSTLALDADGWYT